MLVGRGCVPSGSCTKRRGLRSSLHDCWNIDGVVVIVVVVFIACGSISAGVLPCRRSKWNPSIARVRATRPVHKQQSVWPRLHGRCRVPRRLLARSVCWKCHGGGGQSLCLQFISCVTHSCNPTSRRVLVRKLYVYRNRKTPLEVCSLSPAFRDCICRANRVAKVN